MESENSRRNSIVGVPAVADVPIESVVFSRVHPRQMSTGMLRGEQNVGHNGAKIDSANNRIILTNTDGSQTGFGLVPDDSGDFGFFNVNSNGKILQKFVGGSSYYYDTEGNLRHKVTSDTDYYYNTSGTLIMRITAGVVYYYNTSGVLMHKTDADTDYYYNTSGVLIMKIASGVVYFYDTNGDLIKKMEAATTYIYNPVTSKNVYQDGKLPDSSYGIAVASTGNNVSEGF